MLADQYAQPTTAHSKAEPFSFKSTLQNNGLAVTSEEQPFLTNNINNKCFCKDTAGKVLWRTPTAAETRSLEF